MTNIQLTNHYVVRVEREVEGQYESLRSTLGQTMERQGWMVEQVNFIAGARSLNEEELKENLEYFKVPIVSMETIRFKLTMKIFDEYALRSVQLTEDPTTGTLQTTHFGGPRLLSSTLSESDILTKLGNTRRERTGRGNN